MHPTSITNCNILTIKRIIPLACRPAFHLCRAMQCNENAKVEICYTYIHTLGHM